MKSKMFVQTKGIDLILNISSPIGTEDIGTLSLSPPSLPFFSCFTRIEIEITAKGKKTNAISLPKQYIESKTKDTIKI